MSEAPDSPYLTTKQLGEIIGRKPAVVRAMRSNGTIPKGKRFNRYVLHDRDEIQAWLEDKRDTDPVLYYQPSVQAWLKDKRAADQQTTASAA